MPLISVIAAVAENGIIGRNGGLPWNIPEDMNFFRSKTKGCPVIMGRRTFAEDLKKPLPNRRNIVLTRDNYFKAEGVEVCHSLADALKLLENESGEIFICGGANVYTEGLAYADRLYITEIHTKAQGDTYFPEIPKDIFAETDRQEGKSLDPQISFVTYDRKKPQK